MKFSSYLGLIAGLCLVAGLTACAGGISRQARNLVTYRGSFAGLQQQPSAHIGQTVHLGGKILATTSDGLVSEITILQLPLSWEERPVDDNRSGGRFLIRSRDFLDPEVYKAGSLLSVVGQVMGSDLRPIGRFDYRYPVILPIEIKTWPVPGYFYPAFQIGIGVGGSF